VYGCCFCYCELLVYGCGMVGCVVVNVVIGGFGFGLKVLVSFCLWLFVDCLLLKLGYGLSE